MRKNLFRFRRVAVAAITSATVVGGMTVIGVGAGTAFAAAAPATMVGSDAPVPVIPNQTESVGNFYASFTNNWTSGDTITFQVEDHYFNCGEIAFSGTPTVTITTSPGGDTAPTSIVPTLGNTCSSNDTLTLTINGSPSPSNTDVWVITVSGIHYAIGSGAADGNVAVSANSAESSIVSGAGIDSLSTPSGTSAVSNADVVGVKLGADEPANLTAPGANQPASDLLGSITNSFIAGAGGNLRVVDKAFGNCSGTDTVGFVGTPTVLVTADPSNTGTGETAPTITATYSSSGAACTTAGVNDVITFTVTNNATGLTTQDVWDINISGVEYTVGAGAARGDIGFIINNAFASHEPGNGNLYAPFWGINISNAIISNVVMGANSPPVAIDLPHSANNQAQNQPISNITLTEQSAGILPGGSAPDDWVCVYFPESNTTVDTSTSVPTVSVDGASGATVGTLSVINNGNAMVFEVTDPSTTAGTFTISGINVDTSNNGFTYALASSNQNSLCNNDVNVVTELGDVPAFYAATTHPIYGAAADDTAAAELQYQKGNNGCLSSAEYSVDLARDDLPYDALSGAYLAGRLNSGTLLTPGGSATTVSNSTLNALRIDGAQTVYVLGGPQTISAAIVTQLQNTLAYDCGGTDPLGTVAAPVYLQVIRIWGNTADDTASAIAQYMGTGSIIGKASFSGAWGSMYNQTSGVESAPPVGFGLRTAIVAQDGGWQDAASSGPISWDRSFPILLTPTGGLSSGAENGLTNDNIEQVIVMGGQDAVSNTVVQQIEALGIAVLRIAGQDFTDTSQLTAVFSQSEGGNNLGPDGIGWGDADPYVARGDYFGDALAGAGVAGSQDRPILLSASPTVAGEGMTAYFNTAGLEDGAFTGGYPIQVLRILGGPLAFTPGLIQTLLNEIGAGNDAS